MSELIDSKAECIVGLGPGETARTPLSDTSDYNESLNAESIVGLRTSHHENNFLEKGGVAPISPPSMAGRGGTILSIRSDTIGNLPGHLSMTGRGGTILSISSDTIGDLPGHSSMAGRGSTTLSISNDTIDDSLGHFKSNPPNTSEVTHTRSVGEASELHNSSSNVKFDTGSALEPRRAGQNMSIPSQGDTSKQLHTLINGETGHIKGKIRLAPLSSLQALLELDEMSFNEFDRTLRTRSYRSWWSSNQCWS